MTTTTPAINTAEENCLAEHVFCALNSNDFPTASAAALKVGRSGTSNVSFPSRRSEEQSKRLEFLESLIQSFQVRLATLEVLRRKGDPRLYDGIIEDLRCLVACQWAARAWSALYLSLTTRVPIAVRKEKVKYLDDPASAFVEEIAHRYLKSPEKVVKYLKEQLVFIFASQVGCESECTFTDCTPFVTHKGILASGWVRITCRRLMRVKTRYNRLRAFDVLNAKNLMPRVPAEFEAATLFSHAMALGKIHEFAGEAFKENQAAARWDIHNRIDFMCHKIFGGKNILPRQLDPSQNASFRGPRVSGGSYGELTSNFIRSLLKDGELRKEDLKSFNDTYTPDGHHLVVGDIAYDAFQNWIDDRIRKRVQSEFRLPAFPVSIFEPLKVRVITKGDALFYYRALELQKVMHGLMKVESPFRYIGQPIDDQDWTQRFDPLEDDQFYVSGDYRAFTDNVDPELSEYCWNAMAKEMTIEIDGVQKPLIDTIYYQIGKACLTGHELWYDKSRFTDEQLELLRSECETRDDVYSTCTTDIYCIVVKQKWGQLMGSPMSFPIGCMINAAVSTCGLNIPIESLFKQKNNFCVNGDDIAFKANRDSYRNWELVTSWFGLLKSPGKNYCSKDFVIMNSEMREPGDPWHLCGFVNLPLLCGIERKGVDAGDDLKERMGWWHLGPRARGLIRGFSKEQSQRLIEIFISFHRSVLEVCPPGISWNMSEMLGGAGIPLMDQEIPAGNRLNAAIIAALSNESRQKLLSFPKYEPKSHIQIIEDKAELFYSRQYPKIEVPVQQKLPDWELLPFEKPDRLARPPVMGFVVRARLEMGDDFSSSHHLTGIPEVLAAAKEIERSDALARRNWERHISKAAVFRKAVGRFAQKLQRWLGQHQTTQLEPMKQEHVVSWVPLTETVVDWEHIPFVRPTRFRGALSDYELESLKELHSFTPEKERSRWLYYPDRKPPWPRCRLWRETLEQDMLFYKAYLRGYCPYDIGEGEGSGIRPLLDGEEVGPHLF